jgi:CheY-like chemotaxis protein
MKKILIIDDNATHRQINRQWIETLCPEQFEVIEAGDAATGVSRILAESPACVLLDFIMPGEDGFQALHRLKHDIPDCPPIIFLTCALTEDLKRNALALGAVSCFEKSKITGGEIVDAIKMAIERTVS